MERKEAKFIARKPNAKLLCIQEVYKNTRQDTEFVMIKAKKNMAKQQNRPSGRAKLR